MSAELKDFRTKISVETDAWLEAVSQATGRERQEIARDLLHEEACRYIHAATVLDRHLRAQGVAGIGEGTSGNRRESQGTTGRGRA